ncbi:uncharacterized protein EI97DRAFT_142774 [Westerdykella ornata]|uniref:Uncharacterized protein n=1 Tax=Westerdykella ornata TaxID=318751 RepID=A0A6A6JFN6_WESOR|nr:uncharacterized protein EI97DRAFT_142774 [Westerdykella ornata]KAF2274009.1 hypothetical protein EI97DRAFT_142774 [Westerdykella ornata]
MPVQRFSSHTMNVGGSSAGLFFPQVGILYLLGVGRVYGLPVSCIAVGIRHPASQGRYSFTKSRPHSGNDCLVNEDCELLCGVRPTGLRSVQSRNQHKASLVDQSQIWPH